VELSLEDLDKKHYLSAHGAKELRDKAASKAKEACAKARCAIGMSLYLNGYLVFLIWFLVVVKRVFSCLQLVCCT
jgi:hypothetical protein